MRRQMHSPPLQPPWPHNVGDEARASSAHNRDSYSTAKSGQNGGK